MTNGDKQNWEILLRQLYENERSRIEREMGAEYLVPEDHSLTAENTLSRQEVSDAVQFLWDAGMLEAESPKEWVLTEKGFTVTHDQIIMERQEDEENRRAKRQNAVNKAIGILTAGLVFVAWTEMMIYGLNSTNGNLWRISATEWWMGATTAGVVYIFFVLYQNDLLNTQMTVED